MLYKFLGKEIDHKKIRLHDDIRFLRKNQTASYKYLYIFYLKYMLYKFLGKEMYRK